MSSSSPHSDIGSTFKRELPKPSLSAKIDAPSQVAPVDPIHYIEKHRNAHDTPASHEVEPSAPLWTGLCTNITAPLVYPNLNESELEPPTRCDNARTVSISVSKPHSLIQKKEIKPGKCSVCKRGIGFQKLFFRCQDCSLRCHEECKTLISTACHPSDHKPLLEDFIDTGSQLQVPRFIVEATKEIERRGLNQQGLYRISGSVREIKELKKRWKDKGDVNLSKINDVNVITGVLKSFLKSLSEPIITRQLHNTFLEAGEKSEMTHIYRLINSLPLPNRHTLAFLMLHLRKVARVQENLMDFKALSRVLGPTIVGHGCLNPTNNRLYEEARLQPVLLETFLGLSDEYWSATLGSNDKPCNNTASKQQQTSVHLNESLKSTIDCSLADSPLLGHIDNHYLSNSKRHLPRKPQHSVNQKAYVEKLGRKKFFDTPTLIK